MKNFETAQDIIDFAVKAEREAVRFYTELASTAKSKAMKVAFEDFANEEQGHCDKLLNIDVNKFTFLETSPITDLHIAEYTNPEVKYQSLNYGEVLVIAMNREKRAFMLYNKLSKMVNNNELKKFFVFLAKEESQHKFKFEAEYDDFVLREN